MRLATWNINSLKVRLPRLEEWLTQVQPDIVCLQETKVADAAFPALTFSGLGYEAAYHGQGQWNGVAILSRVGIADVLAGFSEGIEPDADSRLISASCGDLRVHSVYVPNGRAVGHEHYHYKLSWLERLRAHVTATTLPSDPVVIAGDFNVAPDDRDVYDPAKFAGETHVTPPERDALAAIEAWGFDDVFRRHHDVGGMFSWWDYRAGDFHQGRGMRIDLVLGTPRVRSSWCVIDRNARKGQSPSDHAPVVVDFEVV
jgi:exodeoxyribonuclease-3